MKEPMNNVYLNRTKNAQAISNLKDRISKETFFDFDIVLENENVRLKPLTVTDRDQLSKFALDQDIWAYFALKMTDVRSVTNYIEDALLQRESRLRYTFLIEDPSTSTLLGSTAFGNFSKNDSRIEFGWSWLGKQFQGTGINSQVKFLLLSFAFDILNLERVEAKTDVLNIRARKALTKIGMVEEGILRSHTLMPDGRRRDTIYYSMLRNEWPLIAEKIFKDFVFRCSASKHSFRDCR